jgi:hypothetical protein
MTINELDIELPTSYQSGLQVPAEHADFETLEPHRAIA